MLEAWRSRTIPSLRARLARAAMERIMRLSPYPRREVFFAICQHSWGNFRHPRSFNEKVNWRLLYDRRDILFTSCDKLATKERAEGLGICVPRTVWQGTDLRELTQLQLPERWVLKPNHGCGKVYFGTGQVSDSAELAQRTIGWLDEAVEARKGEWAYTKARKLLVVEERIGSEREAPADYKVLVFGGEPRLITVERDRFIRHARRIYTAAWEPLTAQMGVGWRKRPLAPVEPRPETLPQMLDAARAMAQGFEFVRVDLYTWEGRVFFGELTPYPGGGLARYFPRELDFELGRLWQLPTTG